MLETRLEVLDNELELEVVDVPLRGASELDSEELGERELDGVEVVLLEIWLLDSELLTIGEELELDVTVVEY